MAYLRALVLVGGFLLIAYSLTTQAPPYRPPQQNSWQSVINYAHQNLPLEGQLRVKSDGFVYLKVDDRYIHTLFPMLGVKNEGYREPPYFRSPEAPGAHISVFYENEKIHPEEVGKLFHFKLKGLRKVRPSKYSEYLILEVDSPELEELREKYGLAPKLQGHEFHITLAKKTWRKALKT